MWSILLQGRLFSYIIETIASSSLFLAFMFLYLSYDLWSDYLFDLLEDKTKQVDLSCSILAGGDNAASAP
jgi:hypothetical protein